MTFCTNLQALGMGARSNRCSHCWTYASSLPVRIHGHVTDLLRHPAEQARHDRRTLRMIMVARPKVVRTARPVAFVGGRQPKLVQICHLSGSKSTKSPAIPNMPGRVARPFERSTIRTARTARTKVQRRKKCLQRRNSFFHLDRCQGQDT